ncbi:MAG TPA: hypothetical protein VJV23_16255 [Candidatus Polarisedimenticolia bacterium]|nr:hypothetical protein [Candidatus Polarisedimenticolia bacterium]
MRHKPEASREGGPRSLTVSEIRTRVEDIAGEVARKLQEGNGAGREPGSLEARPMDNRKFIALMSDFIRMN